VFARKIFACIEKYLTNDQKKKEGKKTKRFQQSRERREKDVP